MGPVSSYFAANQGLEGGNRMLIFICFPFLSYSLLLSPAGNSKAPGTGPADNLLYRELDILLILDIQGGDAPFHDGDTGHLC